ncbi:MAG: TonB-dependent receptor [Bacteroidales bacterium]|nr:TonB-dependent receptor [Bacteroidales bacterium]
MKYCYLLLFFVPISVLGQVDTEANHNLHEVVVTGTRAPVETSRLPLSVTVLDSARLTEKQQSSLLPTIVQQSPGVMVTQRGIMGSDVASGSAGGINIRGLNGSDGRVMVLIDGHPQYNGVYSHPISDSYQTMMADRVEVVRTPASVIYGGNAMGGVINIVTRQAHRPGASGAATLSAGSYGTVEAEASGQYHGPRFSSMLTARYGRTDNHRPHMGFEQYGGYLNLGYKLSKQWRASATADITHFNSQYPGTVDAPMLEALRWITRGVAQVSIDNNYGSTMGGISAYCNFGRHKINDGYKIDGGTPQTDYFRSRDALAGFNAWQAFHPWQGSTMTLGLDYQHIYGRAYYTNRETGEVVTTQRRLMQSAHGHANEWAGYVDLRQVFNQHLTIEAGIRYDWHSVTHGQVVPMGGIAYNPNAWSQLKGTVSKGFRNPTYKELYMYGTANSALDPENLIAYELAWSQSVGSFSYGLNAYYMHGNNMIVTGTVTEADGSQVTRNINTGKIENWGFEAEASWVISRHVSLNTNHSILHMQHHIIGAPEYKGYLGASWQSGRWSASAGLMQLAGYFLTESKKENATLLDAIVRYAPVTAVSFWVRGENLLAQRYELISGLPMPRATIQAGLNIKFN